MISVSDATQTILSHAKPLGLEQVPILEALGRVLGEDIYASRQQPPWDNSAMDGYAVRHQDTEGASVDTPKRLILVGEVRAGVISDRILQPGEAMRIFTGAPVPAGANAVIRQEDTTRDAGAVFIQVDVANGKDIRRAGEDQEIGDLLVPSGTVIRPGELGVMVGTRRTIAKVTRKPRVAILSNGDELTEPDIEGHKGQIVNTNAYALAAMVQEAGGIATILPIARDKPDLIAAALAEGLKADVFISSGGVSVGDHDHVKAGLAAQGVESIFWKIRMTPGKPVAFGVKNSTLVFGLPGNPVSSMVTFALFVRPALMQLQRYPHIYRGQIQATVSSDMKKRGLPQFLRIRLSGTPGNHTIEPTGPQGSGILRSMALADGLAFADREEHTIPAGSKLTVLALDGRFGTSSTRGF